jgi:antitoxin VapB
MPLFIRDDEVNALAEELARLTRARNKTEAVRAALRHEIARSRRKVPLRERLARAQRMVDAIGPDDPDFDMKRYTDEMWGDA